MQNTEKTNVNMYLIHNPTTHGGTMNTAWFIHVLYTMQLEFPDMT